MKKSINLILLLVLLISVNVQSQIFDDYKLLNSVIYHLTNTMEHDTIRLYKIPIIFDKQKTFFTQDFFKEFTFPTVGVDSRKVKKLMNQIDFVFSKFRCSISTL